MQARITSVGLLIKPDPAESFAYPDHINKASLDALPAQPGIYIFRDIANLPLYIGKSINIRNRVLSHLRTPEEARMLQQTSHIEFCRTAGEIGALLLEARLIKQLHPLHNKKLRRMREMCSLRLASGSSAPEVVHARDHDFARTSGLFGLFATRKAALAKLRDIVDMHMLCPALTGLETQARGRACFARQIARCLGACSGAEAPDDHHVRLVGALDSMRVMTWPYPGPVGIVEESHGWQQIHVIDHWSYLGSIDAGADPATIALPRERRFDIDTYQILAKPMMRGELWMTTVSATLASRVPAK